MIVSLNWLSKYFNNKLPSPEKLEEVITFHAFEVEGVEKLASDTVMDIKVLPDRAHYALCHRGIAYEIAMILKEKMKMIPAQNVSISESVKTIGVKIEDENCSMYLGRRVENVNVAKSPEWLVTSLEAIGQRSINNIVDIANYVMFDIGQPLHAFDADKVKGDIKVRKAIKGERITTLDNKEIELDETVLIIADDVGPLAIAGIKGGKRAEVDTNTKNIILESANFNATAIRKTSNKIGIKTDASKRFENIVVPEVTIEAMDYFSDLIASNSKNAKFSPITRTGNSQVKKDIVKTSYSYINSRLGIQIPKEAINNILNSMAVEVKVSNDDLELTAPAFRKDLVIADDYVDDLGRLYGYDHIKLVSVPKISKDIEVEPAFYWSERVKDALVGIGFSEVYLYSLVEKGDIEVAHPLAKDKSFLRKNLRDGILESLKMNVNNSALLGLDSVKIFEFGKVFSKDGESLNLSIATVQIKKIKGIKSENLIEEAIKKLSEIIGLDLNINIQYKIETISNMTVTEINFEELIEDIKTPESYSLINLNIVSNNKYEKISAFPFIVRDIAIFAGEESSDEVWGLIMKGIENINAKNLLARYSLFDVFKKKDENGRENTSYAYRLVFQSHEKTLTDLDVNKIMESINKEVLGAGMKVR